ncbi:MAG: hypothetical protein ACAF41_12510 [Leptolyngbya sp. BL-A-14]
MENNALKPFTAKFSSQILDQIKSIAQRERRTSGAVIRNLVSDALVQYEKTAP